jgi:hypothetical protein
MSRACVPPLHTVHYKARGFYVASNLVGHLAIVRQIDALASKCRPEHLPLWFWLAGWLAGCWLAQIRVRIQCVYVLQLNLMFTFCS